MCTTVMSSLPDCIYIEIFSYLSKRELMQQLSLVCKRWRRLCSDRYLWKEISTDEFSAIHIDDTIISTLLQRGKNVGRLSLRGCYQISNRVLRDVALNGPHLLQDLNLENCFRITDRGVITLAKACTTLRTVNLLNTLVTESGLCHLIKENPNLIELTATPISVTGKTIDILTTNCKQLEYLHVEQNEFTPYSRSQHKLIALTSDMIEMLACNCPKLQVLILRYPVTSITDWAMALLGQYCKNIECVEIGHQMHTGVVSDAGVINLCTGSTNLLRLDLTETYITDFTLCAIAKHCPSLEHLSIGNTGPVTDVGVLNIMKNCQNLDSFCIRGGFQSRLTDLSVFAIAQSACSYNLIKLSMKSWAVTDFGLYVLSRNLPNLMYLSLEGCTHLTNHGLKEALKHFKSVQSLDLSHTQCIRSDEELICLAGLLPKTFQSVFLQAGGDPAVSSGDVLVTENGCKEFNKVLLDCEIVFVR